MSSSRPISTPRALWILTRLSLRRQLNQWHNIRFARKQRAFLQHSVPTGRIPPKNLVKRSATPTKGSGLPVFSIFLFLLLGFNGFMLGGRGLALLSSTVQNLNGSTGDRSRSLSPPKPV
jgi:hypothetical protein